jgi:hypothetical protein
MVGSIRVCGLTSAAIISELQFSTYKLEIDPLTAEELNNNRAVSFSALLLIVQCN